MAVINKVCKDGTYIFYGLSTDTKPDGDYPPGSIFHEIDTTKQYVYVPTNTNATLGNDWWETAITTTTLAGE